jgi:hypothetical protein
VFVLPLSGRSTVLTHPFAFRTDVADEADALRARLYTWCKHERRRVIAPSELPWEAPPEPTPVPGLELSPEEAAAIDADLAVMDLPGEVAPPEEEPAPAAVVPVEVLKAPPAPPPPSIAESVPGEDEHVAAVRSAVLSVDPFYGHAPIAHYADERWLSFVAWLVRHLPPSEARDMVLRAMASGLGKSTMSGRLSSKTAVRDFIVSEIRRDLRGIAWGPKWVDRRSWSAWGRAKRREERARVAGPVSPSV